MAQEHQMQMSSHACFGCGFYSNIAPISKSFRPVFDSIEHTIIKYGWLLCFECFWAHDIIRYCVGEERRRRHTTVVAFVAILTVKEWYPPSAAHMKLVQNYLKHHFCSVGKLGVTFLSSRNRVQSMGILKQTLRATIAILNAKKWSRGPASHTKMVL